MRLILLFFLCITINFSSFSQRTCGSVEKMYSYLYEHPFLKEKRDSTESLILKDHSISKLSMTIPVVFHVVYNTFEQNISDSQIISQLEVLNKDFNRTNSDAFSVPSYFDSIVASIQINFCLAKQTPNGNPSTGIVRKQTNINSFNLFDTTIHYGNIGGSNAWNTEKYLNIWITRIGGGILGWSQFPSTGSQNTDGVVIDYRYFGTTGTAIYPYNLGRTTTHELGHYFNLFHMWGDNNCGNDLVNDTPTQEEANYGCETHPHISCNNNGDMFMNFMDYTDDVCMNSFTIGQRNRVWSSINNYRISLLTSDGCDEVIVNTADAKLEIVSPEGIIEGCNNPIYPKVVIKNMSVDNLYTAIVKYNINSSPTQYQFWTGSLSQNDTDTILLSGVPIGGISHIIEAEIMMPNNNSDINSSNNTDSKLFQTSGGTSININLITDNYANETSWLFMDANNNIIDSGNNLQNNSHYFYNYCLDNSCYKFVINDSEGDGFCCNYGNGNISINKEQNNQEIASLSTFTYSDTIHFCVSALSNTEISFLKKDIYPNPTTGIIRVESEDFKEDIPIIARVFDVRGKLILNKKSHNKNFNFSELTNGLYVLELEQSNIKTKSKIIINNP